MRIAFCYSARNVRTAPATVAGPGAVRRGRGSGGDHPGDAAGLVRPEHPRSRRCLRRARPHRRLPALGHRASRHAGAAAHPLQERLRRPHGRPRPDRGRDDAQPLPEACHLRAAPAGGHGRAGPGLGDRRSAVKAGRLLAWGGVIALAWLARGLILPVFLAAVLAYLLTPAVAWADVLAIRRSVAVGALYVVIIALLVVAGFLLGPGVLAEASALMDRLPGLAQQIDVGLNAAVRELAESAPALRRLLPENGDWVQRFVLNRGPSEPADLFEHMGHLFLLVILVPFFAFFLLRDMHRLIALVMDRLPAQHVETSVAVWRELNGVIGRYIRGLVLDGLVVGALAALGLWAARVPYPLLLGAFAGLANAVPFVGPLLSAAAAGLVVVLTPGQGLAGVGRVVMLFLVIKVLDDTIIQPFTIGRSVHLHPALLLGSVVVGNHALGVLGMIIAVPVATVLQETVRLLLEHRRMLARRDLRGRPGRLVA